MDNSLTDICTEQTSEENYQWYVLRDICRPNANLPGYKLLEKEEITYFTPMHIVIKKKNDINVRIKEPIIKNLLFAYTNKERLDAITSRHQTLQYRFMRGHSINEPMVVSKREMDRFIYAIESSYSDPIYYTPEEITPEKYGKEVRIIGGNLNGYTGYLLKMRGSKTKRLLVELKSLFVAGVEVEAEYVQFV